MFRIEVVIADLATERGELLREGNVAAARAAAQEHLDKASTLFVNRKKETPCKKRVKKRVKSQHLGLALHQNMRSMGLPGLNMFRIPDDELQKGEHPELWPSGSAVSDKGPDCVCLSHFLHHKKLNLDWGWDPCHGAHHSAQHGLKRANLAVHAFSQVFSYNVGLGEWSDNVRREQVLESMASTLETSGGHFNDVIFRACLRFERPPPGGVWTQDLEASIYSAWKDHNCWHQAETKLTKNKYFGVIQRFKFKECECWGQRLYGLASLSVDLGLLTPSNLDNKPASMTSAASSSTDAPTSMKSAKDIAVKRKKQSKHAVWQAFNQYNDLENYHREWVISDTTGPLQRWYATQTEQLRGVQQSFVWLKTQCGGDYWKHVRDTLAIISDTSCFDRWGIEPAWSIRVEALNDPGLPVHVEQQNTCAARVGDMCLGTAFSRHPWQRNQPQLS